MTAQFFGERWDAPMVDDGVEVPTPVGVRCVDCRERIVVGDRGLVTPMLVDLGEEWAREYPLWERCGDSVGVVIAPVHAECQLRSVMSHIYRQCGCFVPGRSLREEAWGTLAAVNAQRAQQGVGPL